MNVDHLLNEIRQNNGVLENRTFNEPELWNFINANFNEIGNIVVKKCEFKNGLKIIKLDDLRIGVYFEECSFGNEAKGLEVFHNKLNYLQFKSCQFAAVNFVENKISGKILFENGSLKNAVINKNEASFLYIEKLDAPTNQLVLNCPEIDGVYLSDNWKIEKLIINEVKQLFCVGEFGRISLHSKDFEIIQFSSFFRNNELIRSVIFEVWGYSDNITGSFGITGCNIRSIHLIGNVCNSGTILFNNIEIDNLSITDCILKNMYWNRVQFKEQLTINDSEISSLKYSNVSWLPITKISSTDLEFDQIFYKKNDRKELRENIKELRNDREVYRQLKIAAKNIENNVDALEFYRLEMRLYWKEVRINGGISWQNRVLVFLNRWSSDFGQNWLLPIGWLFLFHWLWFSCYIGWSYWSNQMSCGKEFKEYAKLLNPTHEVPTDVSTGFVYLIDIIMRVSVAYFVYHIIRATRKYGKV